VDVLDADSCRRILGACVPSLAVEDVRYLAEGWDSTVFVINESLLVRFPKRPEVGASLERELRLLGALAPSLPAAIPSYLFSARDCAAYPFTFAGYALIEGAPLGDAGLSPAARRGLAADAGRFLRALHDFPTERARELGAEPVSVGGGREQYRDFAAIVRTRIAPLLSSGEAGRLMAWMDAAETERFHCFEPVVVHGDLGPEHLLVDPSSGRLTGVIDFGDCGIGDPAIDIAGLLIALGEQVMPELLAAYGRAEDTALLERARRYRRLGPLHEVIYGLDAGGEAFVVSGLNGVRRRIFRGE
jgi:aminoglycoside phosphotransferase (APT) family kinase protein